MEERLLELSRLLGSADEKIVLKDELNRLQRPDEQLLVNRLLDGDTTALTTVPLSPQYLELLLSQYPTIITLLSIVQPMIYNQLRSLMKLYDLDQSLLPQSSTASTWNQLRMLYREMGVKDDPIELLRAALRRNDINALRLVMENAPLDAQMAVRIAVEEDSVEGLKLLVQQPSFDPNADGGDLLGLLIDDGELEMVEAFLNASQIDITYDLATRAISSGEISVGVLILSRLTVVPPELLAHAVLRGDPAIVIYLCQIGGDEFRDIAIQYAIEKKKTALIILLNALRSSL